MASPIDKELAAFAGKSNTGGPASGAITVESFARNTAKLATYNSTALFRADWALDATFTVK